MPEDDKRCKPFTIISVNSLLEDGKNYYLQVYVDNYAYEIVNKQMTDYLDENVFED